MLLQPKGKARLDKAAFRKSLEGGSARVPSPSDQGRPIEIWQDLFEHLCRLSDSPIFIASLDEKQGLAGFLEANEAFCKSLGFSRDQILEKGFSDLIESPQQIKGLGGRLKHGREEIIDLIFLNSKGQQTFMQLKMALVGDDQGEAVLAAAKSPPASRADMVSLHDPSGGMAVLDSAGTIVVVNPAFCEICGYEPQGIVGRPLELLYPGYEQERHDFFQRIWGALKERGVWSGEVVSRRQSGETYNQRLTVFALGSEDGRPNRYVAVVQDLDISQSGPEDFYLQYNYDPLTGLPNRQLLADRVEQAIARAQRSNKSVGLMCLDIDNFRDVNDSLGQEAGDELLMTLARRMKASLRQDDTVARLAGDEFALVLCEVNDAECGAMVARRVLDSLSEPLVIGGVELYPSAGIGMCLYPTDGNDFRQMFKNAQIALHKAKEQGRGAIQIFTQALDAQVTQRITVEGKLRKALSRGEFRVHYQPKIKLATGEVVGAEALVRWEQPGRGLVSPADFIPLAEETGLIVPMGEWVLYSACRHLSMLRDQGFTNLTVSVNISARQLLWQHDVVQMVDNVLFESRLPAACLELEVTESAVMHNVEGAIATMSALREMGVRLAMDDFGTGYSSLSYLKRFPLDVLKIDRSFIKGVPNDADGTAIVMGIMSLAKSMKLEVVAEGVEELEQAVFLRENKCHQMQGYLFSKPVNEQAYTELLQSGLSLSL